MTRIKKCAACSTYTLGDACPECGSPATSPEPPKFSFPDRHGDHRREARRGEAQ